MSRRVRSPAVLAAALAALLAAPAVGGAATVECGQVLTQDTVVENDLRCEGTGLLAGADGIVVDLAGHRIVHVEPEDCLGCFSTSGVDTNGFADVRVRNGEVRRFTCGVQLRGATSTASGLVLQRNDTGVCVEGRGHRITATSILGGFQGISGFGQRDTTIDGVTTERTSSAVAIFDDLAAGGGVTITGNDLAGGVAVQPATRTRITDNVIHDARFDTGIFVFGGDDTTRIARNRITDVGNGIQTQNSGVGGVRVVANRIVGADFAGVLGTFFGFDDPYGDGGGDVFRRNVVLDAQTGFRLEGVEGAVLRRNVVGRPGRGNGAGIVVGFGASDVRLLRNLIRGNDGDGVRVVPQTADVFLRRNVASGNGGDGFDVRSVSAVVRRNRADDNGRWGIIGIDGVGGSDNVATGNGVGQCTPASLC